MAGLVSCCWEGGFGDTPEDEREQEWREPDDEAAEAWKDDDRDPFGEEWKGDDWPEGLAGPEYWLWR